MNEVKVYSYLEGKYTRNTVTPNAIPEDEKSGTCQVSWGAEELKDLYGGVYLKYNVLNLEIHPTLYSPEHKRPQDVLKKQIMTVVRFYEDAARDIMDSNDKRVGPRWVSRLQNSVCRGIVASLKRIGVQAKIQTLDVSQVSTVISPTPDDFKAHDSNMLKTWRHIECMAEDCDGVRLEFKVIPLFNQYAWRCGFVQSPKQMCHILFTFNDGQSQKAVQTLNKVTFTKEGIAVS